jgi:uncharacterized DUF497 family protein
MYVLCSHWEFVGFEWDEESKAGVNFGKHGVRMPEAIPVFDVSARPAENHEREEYEADR